MDETQLRSSLADLQEFKRLEERGYADLLLDAYPALRKYFAEFIQLPFAAAPGSEMLLNAIEIIRQLDAGQIKRLPSNAPTNFVPKSLRTLLRKTKGRLNRNAWEMGIAFALKDAFRSGDLYLPQSKHHISFWDLTLSETVLDERLEQPTQQEVKAVLTEDFQSSIKLAQNRFLQDSFAQIEDNKLKLSRYAKMRVSPEVNTLQRVINGRLPLIRIERLLIEVDKQTRFSHHFKAASGHSSLPQLFYKTLLAALIAEATNLGIVAMSASVEGVTVDMLRVILQNYVREETLIAASAEIVNQHHSFPLVSVHGTGELSSSDAQRFGIRASSLLASYYPRYYGYYEKAVGIYTHVSDQYSVFSTKVISCSPREALYVLDGLLENNTVLPVRSHTTDTHGYTEILFALCHLLGFYFMPRIKDLKDQQLYRIDKSEDYGVFTPLLDKTADLSLIEEQWEEMLKVALSLKQRSAPAHVVLERLTNSFPSDRLSKAFTHFGRILKTQYILRYITDKELRQTIQLQLNKGEYRHRLPRRIFFADQGEFSTGDYEEMMNKASCLSLVSNAILYWNTLKITDIVAQLRSQGEEISDETLSHISLLPFRHVIPHGAYFTAEL
ncbi:MAG: Tn3 family transposase [Cyanobacteria bacterium P01_H01_bin.15]